MQFIGHTSYSIALRNGLFTETPETRETPETPETPETLETPETRLTLEHVEHLEHIGTFRTLDAEITLTIEMPTLKVMI